MDWLRRNWPDLLIGVALVAVIAMIVATLLSGGSLASLVRQDGPPELPITNTSTAGTATTGSNADPTGAVTTPGTGATATNPVQTPDDVDVFVPGVPGPNEGTDSANGGGVRTTAPQGGTRNSGVTASQDRVALPEASATGGYRVAAGALPSRDAASTLAQSYRDDGYEVTVERQDDLYLLWVGPYTTRADADSVAERIVADGGDALVYTYDGGDDETLGGGSDAASAQPDTDTEAGEAAGVALADAGNGDAEGDGSGAATASVGTQSSSSVGLSAGGVGERFLQVGAFASDESAQPLRAQLEQLGLEVMRNEDASGLIRLFVGPFGGTQLAQTQQRLNAEGIVGSFPVVR